MKLAAVLLVVASVGCAERLAPHVPFVVTEIHATQDACGRRSLTITRCSIDGYYCETLVEPDRVEGVVRGP